MERIPLLEPLTRRYDQLRLGNKIGLTIGIIVIPPILFALWLGFHGQMIGSLSLLGITILSCYVLLALHSSLQRQVASLNVMTGQLLGGVPQVKPQLHTPDEFGAIAQNLAALSADVALRDLHRQTIVDYAVDGILTIDEHDTITTFNPAAERIFGYRSTEIIGMPASRLIPDPLHRTYKLISSGGEVIGRHVGGRLFPMDLTSGQVTIDDRRLFVVIVRDITRRKEAEDELRRTRDAAEAANRSKSEFLASISHELRTPLNAIIGYSELLIESGTEMDADELTDDLQRIHGAGRHLLQMIDDILDIARIESYQIEASPSEFSLDTLLHDIGIAIQGIVQNNQNQLRIVYSGEPQTLYSDQMRVRQVLFNLLNNAAKFTHNGTITLRVISDDRVADSGVLFEIEDTGIGIADDQLERIFEPFTQVDQSSTRRYGGTGMGLALCRKICTLLGGTITARSTLGVGSCFTVYLPHTIRPNQSPSR